MPRNICGDGRSPPPAPWTASRCNRTLRKLTNFVTKLERWHQLFLAASEKETQEEDRNVKTECAPGRLSENTSRNTRKSRAIYTTRTRNASQTPGSQVLRPSRRGNAAPHIPSALRLTKLVATFSGRTPTKAQGITPTRLVLQIVLVLRAGHGLPELGISAHLADEYESIVRQGYDLITAFLVSTADADYYKDIASDTDSDILKPGAISLKNMCLNRLSKDLVEEQERGDAKRDGFDGHRDVMGIQLQELEDYFGDSKMGWPPLRRVLRGCGIAMVAHLVRTGALCEHAATDLALHECHQYLFTDFIGAIQKSLVDARSDPVASGAGYHELPSGGESASQPPFQLWRHKVFNIWKKQLSCQWTLLALQTAEDPLGLMLSRLRFDNLAYFVVIVDGLKPCDEIERHILKAVFRRAFACDQEQQHEDLRLATTTASAELKGLQRVTECTVMDARLYDRLTSTLCVILLNLVDADAGSLSDLMTTISQNTQMMVGLGHDLHFSALQQSLAAEIFFAEICHLLARDRSIPQDLLCCFNSLLCSPSLPEIFPGILTSTMVAPFGMDWERIQRLAEQILLIDCPHLEKLHILLAQIVREGAMAFAEHDPTNPAAVLWAVKIQEETRRRSGNLGAHEHGPLEDISYQGDASMNERVETTPTTARNVNDACDKTASDLPSPDNHTSIAQLSQGGLSVSCQKSTSPKPTAKLTGKHGNARKRKSQSVDFKVYSDGDFDFKKPKRSTLPRKHHAGATAASSCGTQGSEAEIAEGLFGDDLSVLE